MTTQERRAVWSRSLTEDRSPRLRQCQQAGAALELEAIGFVAVSPGAVINSTHNSDDGKATAPRLFLERVR